VRKPRNVITVDGYIQGKPMRGPDEPTEYEVVVAEAAPERVRAWVWSNYRSKYVPEEVLSAFGIRDPW